MKCVMYHYVRDSSNEFPNFNAIDKDLFVRQIKHFRKTKIISAQEVLGAIRTKNVPQGFALTFDDGFREHYNFVFGVLQEYNIKAFFYPSSYPVENKKILDVHKVHLLIGKYDSEMILKKVMSKISPEMLDESKIQEFDKEIYLDQLNTPSQKKIKRLFNYYMKYDYKAPVLKSIFDNFFDEQEEFKKMYMSKDNLLEMFSSGHVIGSHSHNHRVLSRLSLKDQTFEIEESEKFLDSTLGKQWHKNKTFCYPYGGRMSFNENTIKILSSRGYKASFMVGNVKVDNEVVKYPHMITRIDCNRYLKV